MEKTNSNSAVLWTIIILIVFVIIGALIYSHYDNSAANSAATTTADQSSGLQGINPGGPMIPYYTVQATTSPTLGAYLESGNGMTLYTYAQDTAGVSNCTGACATAWPPYTISSAVTLNPAAGVNGQLGSTTRADGTTQVTYNGMPLYYYQGDSAPGQTNGSSISGWSVATP